METRKSTEEMVTTASSRSLLEVDQAEDDDMSISDNIKAMLDSTRNSSYREEMRREQEQKRSYNHKISLSATSLNNSNESVQRNLLHSASAAVVRHWDDPSSKTHIDATQSSFSSPGKHCFRETFEDRLAATVGHEAKETSNLPDNNVHPDLSIDHDVDHHLDLQVKSVPVMTTDDEAMTPDTLAGAKMVPVLLAEDDSVCLRNSQRRHEDFHCGLLDPPAAGEGDELKEELSPVLQKYRHPRKQTAAAAAAKEKALSTSNLFLRMSKQMQHGRRGRIPNPHRRNRIKLNVYDLIPSETVMALPWGCMLPIGKCFDAVNSSLHSMGTGAYHVGIEVNGVEYSYGATDIPGHTGVFSCVPRRSPGYQFRTSIDFGERPLLIEKIVNPEDPLDVQERQIDGREILKQMATEYMGNEYDLLRKNCVTFSHDAAVRLGIEKKEIPSWFRNLCESGAMTQDVAFQTMEPIQMVFSACEDYTNLAGKTIEDGFEIITSGGNDDQGCGRVTVIDTEEYHNFDCSKMTVQRALSWTY